MGNVDYINIYTGIILLIFLTPAGVLWYYEPEQLGISEEQRQKDLKSVLQTILILSPIFLRGLGIV